MTTCSSHKRREKNKKQRFGFVRFQNVSDAERALKKFNGRDFFGLRLLVSKAKYRKGGLPFASKPLEPCANNKSICYPSYRDTRKYSEVFLGRRRKTSEEEHVDNVIPVLFTIHVSENLEMVKNLANAVIVENTEVLNTKHFASLIKASDVPVKCIFSLSTTKMLLLFDSDLDVNKALNEECVLWNLFDDVRRWSEGEFFSNRIVWNECFGLHPKCWSLENIRKIGEKWDRFYMWNKMRIVFVVLRMQNCLCGLRRKIKSMPVLELCSIVELVMYW